MYTTDELRQLASLERWDPKLLGEAADLLDEVLRLREVEGRLVDLQNLIDMEWIDKWHGLISDERDTAINLLSSCCTKCGRQTPPPAWYNCKEAEDGVCGIGNFLDNLRLKRE